VKRILVVFPTCWDEKQLRACRASWEDRFEIDFLAPSDDDCTSDFDFREWLEATGRRFRGEARGVFSSSDYPGAALAALLAQTLGLPGPPPQASLRASHKYYSRVLQKESAPDATPAFWLVDPVRPLAELQAIEFPCFVKPVKGAFSVHTGRVETPDELVSFFERPSIGDFLRYYLDIFNRLLRQHDGFELDGRFFLAEECLSGKLVTVEGFVGVEDPVLFGVVDSVTDPSTGSFVRFDYPSSLPETVQERMHEIARAVIRRHGLVHSMFNVEMTYNEESDRIHVIEVNPRICGQFGDLYAKVDGQSSFEIALAISSGERPHLKRREGPSRMAASFPLRVFEKVRVVSAPSEELVHEAEAEFPGALVWSECQTGSELSNFEQFEDGKSCRYAVVNVGGDNEDDLLERFEALRRALAYRFEPLKQPLVSPSPAAIGVFHRVDFTPHPFWSPFWRSS
jgi:hypothetical protein